LHSDKGAFLLLKFVKGLSVFSLVFGTILCCEVYEKVTLFPPKTLERLGHLIILLKTPRFIQVIIKNDV